MADEAIIPQEPDEEIAAEAEPIEPAEPEPEPGDVEPEAPSEDEPTEPVPPELMEVNFGGIKLEVPRDFQHVTVDNWQSLVEQAQKSAGDWQADYTRKTQAIADQRKSLETAEATVQRLRGLQGEALQHFARGMYLKEQIDQLDALDMRALRESDPDQFREVLDQKRILQDELERAAAQTNHAESQMAEAQNVEIGRRTEEGRQTISRQVRNFDGSRLEEYAVSKGVTPEAAKQWPLNPAMAVMAWQSMLFEEMQAKAAVKPPPKAPARPVTPAGRSRGRDTSSRPSDSDSAEAWVKKRNAELIAKRKARGF